MSRNYFILNVESTATKCSLRTAEQRNREILKAVDEKSKKFDKNSTVVQQGINISWNHTLSLGFDFFVSAIHVRLSSLSDSPIIWMPKDFASRHFLISAKDFCSLPECNQDFVAPHHAIYPCELRDCSLLSWHQHRERTSSGVVFWTGSDRDAVVIVRQNERMKEVGGG